MLFATLGAGLGAIGGIVLQPVTMLAAIAFLFGGTDMQIAAFAVIAVAAWSLAPILVLALGTIVGDSYPVMIAAGVIRVVAVVTIGFIGFQINDISTSRVVGSLIVAYLLFQVGSAVAGQTASGVMLSSVPRSQQAAVYRLRGAVAVVAALAGALACWSVFRSDDPFQRSAGHLLVLAALSLGAATWFLLSNPGRTSRMTVPQPRQLMRLAVGSFGGPAFRRYLSYKVLLGLAAALDPFAIVFGFRELGLDVSYLGGVVLAFAVGQFGGHLLWPWLVEDHGARIPFQVAALCRLLFLTLAISLPSLATSAFYADRFDDPAAAMSAFAVGFGLLGLAMSVGNPCNQRYLMDIAPRGTVQGSILAANLAAGIVAFAPFGVAGLLGRYDLERLLWVGIGIAIVALLASGLLVDARVRIRTAPGAWRTRSRTRTRNRTPRPV